MTKILSKPNCVFCMRTKALFDMKNIPYEEKLLDVDFNLEEFSVLTNGAKTFPQIWVTNLQGADVHVGGFDQLKEYLEENLEKVLI